MSGLENATSDRRSLVISGMSLSLGRLVQAGNRPTIMIDPTGMAGVAASMGGSESLYGTDMKKWGEEQAQKAEAANNERGKNQNNLGVGETAATLTENNGKPVKEGTNAGCYAYVWQILQEAYKTVDGEVPSVLVSGFKDKTDVFDDGTSVKRKYPNSNSPFANLFASKAGMQQDTPDNLKGTGAAGAIELAGLGEITNTWSNLKKGAILQFWSNEQEQQKAKNGQVATGHVAIFLGYSQIKGQTAILYADQWGKHAITSNGQVYNQTYIRSQFGYAPAANHNYSIIIGSNIKSVK